MTCILSGMECEEKTEQHSEREWKKKQVETKRWTWQRTLSRSKKKIAPEQKATKIEN